MTTIALLRTGYLNTYLARQDADTQPWSVSDLTVHLGDAISSLWPTCGTLATGDVATVSTGQEYTIPGSISKVSRIELLDSSGHYLSPVTNWRPIPGGKVVIKPLLASGYTLRFTGWKPFDNAGSDLPASLENVVAQLAAAQAYGQLAASLTNSQRQQTIDSGRVVDHQQAVALSAYWQRLAQSNLQDDPARVSYAPRRARR